MKTQTPADAGRGQGLGLEKSFPAISVSISTIPHLHEQRETAAAWLTRRFGLPPATAAADAELAGMGGAR